MTQPTPPTPRDPLVGRVNDLTTTFLDTAGVLLFAGAAGYFGWTWQNPAIGLLWAGIVLLMLSTIAQSRQRPKRAKVRPGAHPHPSTFTTPESSGTVHTRGR